MSEFVEQCRAEWKRLGVSDPAADEMAADLAADLREAEAEGTSPEAVLGSDAFNPRSFAASWAAERGLIPPPPPPRPGKSLQLSRALVVGAVVAVLAIVVVIAGLVVVTILAPPAVHVSASRGVIPGFPVAPGRVFPPGFPQLPTGGPVTSVEHVTGLGIHVNLLGVLLLLVGIAVAVLAIGYWWTRHGPFVNHPGTPTASR